MLFLFACHHGTAASDAAAAAAGSAIGAHEALRFSGTEPFWSGEAADGTLTWHSPEHPDGERIAVTRFDGRNGVGYSGTLGGQPFQLAASAVPCRDGMSGSLYPFAVTVQLGAKTLRGCGWSDRHPSRNPR